ncbi:MAG TPA: FAD-dependent oxidoreductase, partial [Burkholderiaceae bacterium]
MKKCVVIGGGVVGLTTAWALAERGHRVTLIEREAELGQGTSYANGGQLSYRYVSPLADAGVPMKALRWLFDPDGPLRFKLEPSWQQWSWLIAFLRACRGPVNRRTTARLLQLGAFSQQSFGRLHQAARLDDIDFREPGKLVVYRKESEFARVAERVRAQGTAAERALDHDECVALEASLDDGETRFAGGIFTEGEAVADCYKVCLTLAERLRVHGNFDGFVTAEVSGFETRNGRISALRTSSGEIACENLVLAAGLQSRALGAKLGITLPIYPLKGYSLTAPIEPGHRAPEVSVTDFERKTLYARIGKTLRVAAMADLVGADLSLDPKRLDTLQRSVRETFPHAANYDRAQAWAGLRPATPSGAPILGATRYA